MKYDWVVYSLIFAPYSALFGPAALLVTGGLSAFAPDAGCAVFGFSIFCACTLRETCQSDRVVTIANKKIRRFSRDIFAFMANSRRESLSGLRRILQPDGTCQSKRTKRAKCKEEMPRHSALCPLLFATRVV